MIFPAEHRIRVALVFAATYGSIDGADHKQWIIDQMVRALTGCPVIMETRILGGKEYPIERQGASEEYLAWVVAHNEGEDGPDTYAWETGTAP